MWPPRSADTVCPRPPLTLTFDRLTLKLVCESHLRWGTFFPSKFGQLGSWVLEVFAIHVYATDEQTDRRTDKSNAYCVLPYGRGMIRTARPCGTALCCCCCISCNMLVRAGRLRGTLFHPGSLIQGDRVDIRKSSDRRSGNSDASLAAPGAAPLCHVICS